MTIDALQAFNLVGGTALSLYYGHRTSIDLDLFCVDSFDNSKVINSVTKAFENEFSERSSTNFGIFGFINDVKVDIVRFPHPIIRPTVTIEGIRMYSPEDIIAMKVQAILGRGKKKDFWDVAELLNHFTVKDFIDLHKEKYSTQNLYITVPQAITYFDDAEDSEDPVSLNGLDWSDVKNIIGEHVRNYLA
ncbi:MAG TPA: nucleotidyl transferase AbiEii/AbiGii toxin family protein [Saprospiraceae bacterium]|nr:nucleotidyl transferase AbiEii/AbiGii toxin family protein [Saprospiraceae bacterium]HPN69587.1 nucleotidyl transferase AbiEii/AbiGii toxin family protein [Saprospiraceae bacterium]